MPHEQSSFAQVQTVQDGYIAVKELFAAKRYADALSLCDQMLSAFDCGDALAKVLMAKAMSEYGLGLISAMDSTIDNMAKLELTPDVRCRWLMLKGRSLAHKSSAEAFGYFESAEFEFGRLCLPQDEAWAQLSASRLAVKLRMPSKAYEAASRVRFQPYLPKSALLQAEAMVLEGKCREALNLATKVQRGEFGLPDQVDLARTAYVKAASLLLEGNLIDAGLLLGEARNRALSSAQRDYELLNAIEELRTRLEEKGG